MNSSKSRRCISSNTFDAYRANPIDAEIDPPSGVTTACVEGEPSASKNSPTKRKFVNSELSFSAHQDAEASCKKSLIDFPESAIRKYSNPTLKTINRNTYSRMSRGATTG